MLKQVTQYSFGNASLNQRKWGQSLRRLGFVSLFSLTLTAGHSHAEAAGLPSPTLYGRWGFSAAGTIQPPIVPEPTEAAVVGVMTFDGRGRCTVTDTLNVGGTTASRTSTSCTYAVTQEGVGKIVIQFAEDPAPIPLSFVLVDGQHEFHFVRTDVLPAVGVAKRQ